jgi:transposase
VSIAGALAYRWDGRRARILFQTRPGSYDTPGLIEFVRQLRPHFRKQPVILIWDGLPSHRSREMLKFLESQSHWLEVVRLPGYAPEMNPVETLWAYLKKAGLRTLSAARLRRLRSSSRMPELVKLSVYRPW